MRKFLTIYRIFCEEFPTGKHKTLYIKTKERIDSSVSDESMLHFIDSRLKPNVDFTIDHICVDTLGKQDIATKEIF